MRRGRLRPAALLAVGLVLSSCTDEADRAAGTSTTVTAGPTTTTTAPRIDAVAPELVEQLDAAEGDVCEIVKVQDRIRSAGVDETPESVSSVVLVTVMFFTALADAAPADQTDAARTLRAAAEQLRTEASDPGFDFDDLRSSAAMTSPELRAAIADYVEPATSRCP